MSTLDTLSQEFRDKLIAKNDHNSNSEYSASHPDALSDGDNYGKGNNNASVGGADDIAARNRLLAKNKYNSNNEYDSSDV
jgi:hypothetical protein